MATLDASQVGRTFTNWNISILPCFRQNKYYNQVTMSHEDDTLIGKLHAMIKDEITTTLSTTIRAITKNNGTNTEDIKK